MCKKTVFSAILLAAYCVSFLGCSSPESGPPIITCGGGMAFPCPQGMYCDYGEDCGGFDKKGVCTRQPKECPLEDEPVCGCDSVNYDSPCYARAQGVTIAHEGECIRKTIKRTTKRKKMEFPDSSAQKIDGSAVENAGDRISEDGFLFPE